MSGATARAGLRAPLVGLALAASGIGAGELLAPFAGTGLVRATGLAVRGLLAAGGVPSVLEGGVLSSPAGFAFEITPACLGLGPAAVVAILVAFNTRGPVRRSGLALAGAATLLAANLVRLVALFCLGCAAPESFDLFHHGLGQAWMLLAMAAFLLPISGEAPARAVPEALR